MKVLKRQKINTLLSAAIAAVAGSMLASGYGMDSSIFFWIFGGGVMLTGLVQAMQDITEKQIVFGSSDVMIGAGKFAIGCWIAFGQKSAQPHTIAILAGMAFFHGLYLLQQAVEVRRLQKMEAGIILAAAAASAIAGVEILLAFSEMPLGIEFCLFLDAGALLLSGILMFLVKPAQPAKKPVAAKAATPAKPVPAAEKVVAVPAGKAPENAPAKAEPALAAQPDTVASAEVQDASTSAAADAVPAACAAVQSASQAPAASTAVPSKAAPAKQNDNSGDALAKLGSFASKTSKRMRTMAKDTMQGFQEGLHEDSQK